MPFWTFHASNIQEKHKQKKGLSFKVTVLKIHILLKTDVFLHTLSVYSIPDSYFIEYKDIQESELSNIHNI